MKANVAEKVSIFTNNCQLEQARTAVERAGISHVYLHALYPNGDGELSRDQVLHEHIRKLSKIITKNCAFAKCGLELKMKWQHIKPLRISCSVCSAVQQLAAHGLRRRSACCLS